MYDKHTDEELGINIHSLNNIFCKLRKEGEPLEYVTKTSFTIRKGEIVLKETEGNRRNNKYSMMIGCYLNINTFYE